MLNIIVFALLFTLMWNFRKKPHGLAVAGYFFAYGTVRSVMEPLRDGQYILGSSLPISQVFAILMAVGGVLLFVAVLFHNRRKYGKAFGAAFGEPLAVLPKYYTAEQRRKMEEARRAKEKAAKLAAQGAQDTAKAVPLPPAEQKDDKK